MSDALRQDITAGKDSDDHFVMVKSLIADFYLGIAQQCMDAESVGTLAVLLDESTSAPHTTLLGHILRKMVRDRYGTLSDQDRQLVKELVGLNPVLQCQKCNDRFAGEIGNEYPAGVLCPSCKDRGLTVVGVCHFTGEYV